MPQFGMVPGGVGRVAVAVVEYTVGYAGVAREGVYAHPGDKQCRFAWSDWDLCKETR